MVPTVAYVAGGRLHVKAPDKPARVVESTFAEAVRERGRQIEQRHNWKTEGRGARFMSGGLLWGAQPGAEAEAQVVITGLTPGVATGDLVYVLQTGGLAAVCAWNGADGVERRLLHGSERRLTHLAAGDDKIACSVWHKDGSASIALMQADASDLAEITEGDAQDLAPAWVPGAGRRIVYQSAGVGRNQQGQFQGLGPSAIQELDLERGDVRTLAEDKDADLLGPRVDGSGTLYYIRRPRAEKAGLRPLHALLDLVLLPFRLFWAVFQYLNFFSTRYTGKPLTTAGGPKREGADIRQMMVWGNLIDAERAAREAADGDEPASVVPPSWTLVRRRPDNAPEVIARGVVSFDLAPDGSLVYCTGRAVYHFEGGRSQRLCADDLIEHVVVLR